MVDIVILRSNSIVQSPRVRKIAGSLKNRYSVAVLGWNREGISKKLIEKYIVELQLYKMKAPIGKFTLIAYLPAFWSWIFYKLIAYRPSIVHAIDLDTVLPCYLYKILFRKKLVFDLADRYAFSRFQEKHLQLFSIVNFLEEKFCKKADVLVTSSKKMLDTIRNRPENCSIILNCSTKQDLEKIESNKKNLTLVYTGNIIRQRGLEKIVSAINNLRDVDLFFAGRIIDEGLFKELSQVDNVKYKGLLSLDDALSLTSHSDVVIILYDLAKPMHKIGMPNKIFEAMKFSLPIITNQGTDIINECGCGIIVDYNNTSQIKSAIVKLRDDKELRKMLGEKGRKAFEQKYNWQVVEKELLQIYDNLFSN